MKPIKPDEKLLSKFPEGSRMCSFDAPEGLESDVETAYGIAVPGGSGHLHYMFVMEMSHEEWKDFKKNRRLILAFHSGVVPVFSLGAFHDPEDKARLLEGNNQNGSESQEEKM